MAFKDLIEEHVTTVFLNTDQFADSITRRPLGVSADDVAVDAIFEEMPQSKNFEGGEQVERTAHLHIDVSTVVDESDEWVIDSVVWQTVKPGRVENGFRIVTIQRNNYKNRRMTGGVR